jgi:hypothetical protein
MLRRMAAHLLEGDDRIKSSGVVLYDPDQRRREYL